jgi:hypothetical protein
VLPVLVSDVVREAAHRDGVEFRDRREAQPADDLLDGRRREFLSRVHLEVDARVAGLLPGLERNGGLPGQREDKAEEIVAPSSPHEPHRSRSTQTISRRRIVPE